jgi:Tol biopolymer transport system component
MIGRTIAHYTITAKLGAGGMGEVWRADDTKLGREVAIKLLPEEVAGDAERLARFQREAQVLASLDHPNIAAIYALEAAEIDGREAHLLVMQLAEGETLEQRIARGSLPLDEALPIALQIAEALGSAHESGIVHRDLKPANVKVDAEGRVRLLDFGLAKAMAAPVSSSGNSAQSPTLTVRTEAGMLMGTAAYMSPEQARGKEADRRSDVWAFGCVLHEMLTGTSTFKGDTVSDTLAAILREEIGLGDLPSGTPRQIERLLRRCLNKDPRHRLQDIGDARIEIEEARAGVGETEVSGATAQARPGRGPLNIALGAVAVVAVIVALWLARMAFRDPGATSFENGTFRQVTSEVGGEIYPSLSPDGKWLVYVAPGEEGDLDIFRLRVGGRNPDNLTADSNVDDAQPAVSADGERIAFRSERDGGGIFVMGATGESVRRVTDGGFNPAWSPDGKRIAFGTEAIQLSPLTRGGGSELWVVDVETEERRKLANVAEDAVQPSFSPNGERIVYWSLGPKSGQRDLVSIRVDGTGMRQITDDSPLDWGPVWASDGHVYFISTRGGASNVWRVAVDITTGEVLGPFEPVTAGVGASPAHLSLSADGDALAFTSGLVRSNIARVEVDFEAGEAIGAPENLTRGNEQLWSPSISPDGESLAFARLMPGEAILITRSDGSGRRTLVADEFKNRLPRWSPDGKRIAFYSDRDGAYRLYSIRPDGSGLDKLVDEDGAIFVTWSPDGKEIAFDLLREGRGRRASIGADGKAEPSRGFPPLEGQPEGVWFEAFAWSPDGTSIAGTLRDSAYAPRGIVLFDVASETYRVLNDLPAMYPAWTPDGRFIVAGALDGMVHRIDAATGASRPVANGGWSGLSGLTATAVSPDGRFLYYAREEHEFDVWLLTR